MGQTIDGSCSLIATELMAGTYTCDKIDSRTIRINMDYQQALMISQTIKYIVKVEDVTTPTSTAPIHYTIKTTFNSITNQQFSASYAIV